MPTGYTHKIYEGEDQSFEDFALTCARAFGATIEMRDLPLDAPIPDEWTPDTYHLVKRTEAEQRLRDLDEMSDEDCNRVAQDEWMAAHQAWQRALDEKRARRERYESMLRQVEAWVPPTPDHDGMKKFMIEQITGSIEFDCSMTYYDEPQPMTGVEWRNAQVSKALRDIDRNDAEYGKEIERTEQRNGWVRALRESLGGVQEGQLR